MSNDELCGCEGSCPMCRFCACLRYLLHHKGHVFLAGG